MRAWRNRQTPRSQKPASFGSWGFDSLRPHSKTATTKIVLELADCYRQIELEFELDSEEGRANSLHKRDTLLAALRVFRKGLVEEFEEYDRRERELDASRE